MGGEAEGPPHQSDLLLDAVTLSPNTGLASLKTFSRASVVNGLDELLPPYKLERVVIGVVKPAKVARTSKAAMVKLAERMTFPRLEEGRVRRSMVSHYCAYIVLCIQKEELP